ncbi:S66 peptidase family protein [Lentilactobacillus raoultii]|uniref:S66 peptidase family protein n=1 Tax=Lentilactobacillus raoultii TaxID=1987503 RepID=A0ABW3PJP4_9LACO|nr:S66 peptidase family protein [Lentilactobacillus raoultii]
MIKPHMLHVGDKVAVVSLSGGILGEPVAHHQLTLGINRLKEFGLDPVIMPNALKGLAFLKNHPEARADDLKQAFADESIKGIICAIGGNDTYRLLPYLLDNPTFIKNVKQSPKLFTGFSDTTINHLMFYQLGMTSFYGPNFLNDLAELDHEMLPYTKHYFQQYFQNEPTVEIKSSPIWYEERTDFSPAALGTSRVTHPEKHGYEVLRGSGTVTGPLLGGCIDSLYSILAGDRQADEKPTAEKYHLFPDKADWHGKILFIETSEEQPNPVLYRQMLLKLKDVGTLSAVAAIIVGKPQNERYYDEYKQALIDVTKDLHTPILFNVNFGHGYPRTVLPYGINCQINFDQKIVKTVDPWFKD